MRVVDVPEKLAFLQIIGYDDKQHAFRAKDASRLGDELARGVDARHVLEHLVGVHYIRAAVARGDGRRPRVNDVEPFTRELVGEHTAGFDAAISPSCGDCRFREAAVSWTDLEHIARRPCVLHDEAKAGLFNTLA